MEVEGTGWDCVLVNGLINCDVNKKLIAYLRELSIVIFGVSIAFWMNKWSENTKSLEKERLVLETVSSEIGNNNFYVKEALRACELVVDQYDSVLLLLKTKDQVDVNMVLTISKLLFQDSGMDLAISMGVLSDIRFELARDISFCYKLQQNILGFEKAYFDYLEVEEEDREVYYTNSRTKVNNFIMALQTLDKEQAQLKETVEEYISTKF